MDYLKEHLRSFIESPYEERGDLFDWFLFIGLMTALTILWTRVIRRLAD